jgi:hypothetical protein
MPTLDYDRARQILDESFSAMEAAYIEGAVPCVQPNVAQAYDLLFKSTTQAYREVLLGCILARFLDESIDIRLPYAKQGAHAYNGRTLDERVVNPFLGNEKIPCSKGPFLSVFRRSVKFDQQTRDGVRDKAAFDALLEVVRALETSDQAVIRTILEYHLYCFIRLREESKIEIARLRRISLEQCDFLLSRLLETKSGGRLPVFLVVATFRAIKDVFQLDWEIEFQGINVADEASQAGGDITLRQNGETILAAEITERSVDRNKVISTFDTKIAPHAIEDYLFFIKDKGQSSTAIEQAKRYFSQGHEVNFVETKNWIVTILSILGGQGRQAFVDHMLSFLDNTEIPTILKIKWNEIIHEITSGDI